MAAALSLLTLGGIAAGSSAAANRFETDVEITNGGPTEFEGRVSSKKARCEADRRVILFRLDTGRRAEEMGKTRTDGSGRWSIEGEFPEGDYKARVPKRKAGSVVCLRGGSQVLPAR